MARRNYMAKQSLLPRRPISDMTIWQRKALAQPSRCMACTRVVAKSSFSRTDIKGSKSSHRIWYSDLKYCNIIKYLCTVNESCMNTQNSTCIHLFIIHVHHLYTVNVSCNTYCTVYSQCILHLYPVQYLSTCTHIYRCYR